MTTITRFINTSASLFQESIFSFRLIGASMSGATLNFGYTCRNTVIFGTLKDSSLWIKNLASNNCLTQKRIPKLRQRFVKNALPFSFEKLKLLCSSNHTILFKFHQHKARVFIKKFKKRLLTPYVISISNGNIKRSCRKIASWNFEIFDKRPGS